MATLYITEYTDQKTDRNGQFLPVGDEPANIYQSLAITSTAVSSSAFLTNTRFIRMHADTTCSYKLGSNPTAVTFESRLSAGVTEYVGVTPGHKISVISNT